jgi:GMP synthase-like glutamine amidotransferase|tara:strand:+ start:4014 stop:4709 length:696 start_codon:yes stop_codon:yes gene_type:complete
MRAHYLQHVPFEGLGSIEPWLHNAGYKISNTRFFDSGVLPEIEDIDLLVVMGGPMSVNDETGYPWLVKEKEFIRSTIEVGRPVVGICLGAQLIANAMGGEVFPNSVKEIGWFPIEAVKSGGNTVFQFPEETEVFHWHGETFNLPKGAVQMAKSKGCVNQAFQIGSNVIGLQFHLETTPVSAQAIVENCRDELVDGEYIQSETDILAAPQEHYSSINSLMGKILEHLHASNN